MQLDTRVLLQNEKLASTLVGMHTPELVEQNVRSVLQALGLEDNPAAAAEAATLQKIEAVMQPVLNVSWPSGKAENN